MILGFLCSFGLIAASFSACGTDTLRIAGYVEGEYVRLGPIDSARIERIEVRRGDKVEAGKVVAVLEKTDAENSVAEARAARGTAVSTENCTCRSSQIRPLNRSRRKRTSS